MTSPEGPHFACSRCAHRQDEDVECKGCQNPVVQDLRDMTARRMLHEAESRESSAKHRRFIQIGAAAGVVAVFIAFGFRAKFSWFPHPGLIGFGAGLGVSALLEIKFGRRLKFPYLEEYER